MQAGELRKIRDATNGLFKGKARKRIKESLEELFHEMNAARSLEPEPQRAELLRLMNLWTTKRQDALARGASGYGDADWAAAAACESWIHATLGMEGPALAEVEELVRELLRR